MRSKTWPIPRRASVSASVAPVADRLASRAPSIEAWARVRAVPKSSNGDSPGFWSGARSRRAPPVPSFAFEQISEICSALSVVSPPPHANRTAQAKTREIFLRGAIYQPYAAASSMQGGAGTSPHKPSRNVFTALQRPEVNPLGPPTTQFVDRHDLPPEGHEGDDHELQIGQGEGGADDRD